MNKKITAATRPFTQFSDKIAARWQLLMQPNTPAKVTDDETTESILADLVAMPTTPDNREAIHEAMEYIDDFLSRRGFFVERLEWNGVESLVATTRNTKTPTIFLAGHIDVVPGAPTSFQLRKEDGKYYGRGVLDMKGGIAAFLGAIQKIPGDISEYDFGVMVMSDEEVGGFDGAAKLADAGYLPKVMILPDGGDNHWGLEQFAKGIWHVTLQAPGKSAHGSRPWEGENAIDKLQDTLQAIRALFPKTMNTRTSTMNVGMFEGGKAINQIPASATTSIDFRFASPKDQKHLQQAIRDILDDKGIEVITELVADPVVNDPENPYLQTYVDCTKEATGITPAWVMSNAGSDARFFTSKGVPCAIAYPVGSGHHGADECITQESLEQMTTLVHTYIQRVARNNQ